MESILETERLRLRKFNRGDADFIVTLLNSPGWLQFIGDRNIHTASEAVAYLEKGPMKSYEENGFGLSMVEIKQSNLPIGMCGLIKRDTLEHPDVGFALLPEFAGMGYGFEIASAVLSYGRETWNLATIGAITQPDNKRSIRLLGKMGLNFSRKILFGEKNEELLLFEKHFEGAELPK